MHIYMCVYVDTCVRIYAYACVYICVCMCVCICLNTFMPTTYNTYRFFHIQDVTTH